MNRLIRLVLDLMPTELRQLTVAAGLDVEATCRLQPLAELFALARKSRGWTSPRAAKVTGTRRRTIDAAESANPARIIPDELIAYSARLGTLHLLGEWVSANPKLAGSLGFPTEETILGRGRQILADDARQLTILPDTLPTIAPRRFEAPPGFSDHLDPDAAEARLSGLLPSSLPTLGEAFGHAEPETDPNAKTDPEPPPALALPAKPAAPALYEFKVALRNVHPSVWRRIRVPNSLTFARLHDVLQMAMGWENAHLHTFTWRDLDIGPTDPEWNHPILDETRVTLAELGLRTRAKITYRYDFGDDWCHDLRLERILPHTPDSPDNLPTCLAGEGACPPEDCGGPLSYSEMLHALRDPNSPEAAELLDWIDPNWRPGAFNLERANARLASLAKRWSRPTRRRSRKA